MNYTEAVNYIHSLLKFGIRPGLSGMDALLRILSNPHKGLKYVHVAGTNGKGSMSTALSNVLIDSGYRVGLYTSPYVTDFLERVQFCGKPVDKAVFAKSVQRVKTAVEALAKDGITVTEFEALTASAFLCFKECECDIVVLEVGLGGRLDATNIIDTPLVNVITSLSVDHSAILGDTVEQIAFEKCGTIKQGGRVVCSCGQPEGALKVIKQTVDERCNTLLIPDFEQVTVQKSDVYGTLFLYKGKEYSVTMPGLHQLKNMTVVIEVCELLKNYFNIPDECICSGISKTVLPARVEVVSKKPLVVLDGGHNKDGASAFYNAVSSEFKGKNKVYVIAGMMADKAVEDSLAPLMKSADTFVCVTPENPRSMKGSQLCEIASRYCKNVIVIDSPCDAVKHISNEITQDDMLCIVGSLYLAGEVRSVCIDKF